MVASHHIPDMSAIIRLPWQHPLPCNGPLDIQQLWASEGRTREPILMKFGIQQEIQITMTVTWSNIKIFKIQNGGRSLLKNIRNAITRGKWTDWVATRVVASHHVPNFGNAISLTPLTMGPIGTTLGWSRPSNTSAAKPFPWYWSLLLAAQWTFWFFWV